MVLVLSSAIGAYSAVALVLQVTTASSGPKAFRAGAEVGLLAGILGALVLAEMAFALHFRWTRGRRLVEYSGLFAHGLPGSQVARSLAVEQHAVTWSSLLPGGLLGVLVAAATQPGPGATATSLLAALAAGALVAGFAACTLVVGAIARRVPARGNPLPDPWLR